MSTPQNNFTPEQSAAINEAIATAKKDILDTVHRKVVEVISNNQQVIIESVQKNITEAINANQKVIIAAEQNGLTKVSDADKKEETKNWKVFMVVLPIILSTILGFMIWNAQTRIQQDVSDKSENLKTQLALMQEFYKKKLAVYEETHKQMALLVDALQSARINPDSVGKASDSLRSLNQTYKINNLYVSNELAKELEALWKLGIEMPALRKSGKATMAEVLNQVSLVEAQMKKDLEVNEIGQISKIVSRDGS